MAHKHSVYDTDPHFSINPDTRAIKNLSTTKTSIIQLDHNSERFTFELPRYIDGHDMSLCNVVQVHYINIGSNNKNPGVYEVTDLQISPDGDDVVICSWLLSSNVTQLAGTLNFAIRFACTTGDVVDYAWHTAIFSGISVLSCIDNSEVVVEDYSDILLEWEQRLQAFLLMDLKQTVTSTEDDGLNVWTATFNDGTVREFHVRNGKQGSIGEPGAQGAVGPSGVHLGSDEPTEDYDVWIDPNGNVFPIGSGDGDDSVCQLNSYASGSDSTSFGYKCMTLPCKTYIKDDVTMSYADGELIFEWTGHEGSILAADNISRDAIIAYRYWCDDIENYSYEHITTDAFPVHVSTEHTVDTEYMDVLFAGILASDEEMDDTITAESLKASMASGFSCFSCGKGSYSGGYLSIAWKPVSFAYGYQCLAFGDSSIAIGGSAQALSDKSVAIGIGTVAANNAPAQCVLGSFNVIDEDGKYSFIIGNGKNTTPPTRSNALTLDKQGNMWVAGKMTVGSQSAESDNDLTPKSYVDSLRRMPLPDTTFIYGINGEKNIKTYSSTFSTETPNQFKKVCGYGSYQVSATSPTTSSIEIVSAKNRTVDCSDTELLGVWIKYESTAEDGETSSVRIIIEATSSGNPDNQEISYYLSLSPSSQEHQLKDGWNFYKLDLNGDNSVPAKTGALKYSSKTGGECDTSAINYVRVYVNAGMAHCKINVGQYGKIVRMPNEEFIEHNIDSLLTLNADGKVTAIGGHEIA